MKSWASVVTAVAIVGGVVVLTLRADDLTPGAQTIIIMQLLGYVPAILALRKAENVQHDIRNGLVTEKAKDGFQQAMHEMAEPVSNAEGETVAMIVSPTYTGPERRKS